ncbi:MAG TPA: ABC transporter permease [Polyangiaceae bacterium]|jgi:ABC-2 family transporter|nr:ABC transporter permease [Polyangiaceae bacterium]
MRWYILRTLLLKELLRQLKNRGGITMALVIVAAAVLASVFGSGFTVPQPGAASMCIIDHWRDDGWIAHLRNHVPRELEGRVRFRSLAGYKGAIGYPPGAAGIQLRPTGDESLRHYKVSVWYPDPDGASVAPFETWFWAESRRYFQGVVGLSAASPKDDFWSESQRDFVDRLRADLERAGRSEAIDEVPDVAVTRSRLEQRDLDLRSPAAMFLVLMALCFVCIFLMPSATAEERERGTLLAQALSPASSLEILGAKLLFYPTLAVVLASLVAGICQPRVWTSPFFWIALGVTALATVGIGLTISVLARTQREASMGALSYMLSVALILIICRQNDLRFPATLMIEYHGPSMILAALRDAVAPAHWGELAVSWVLAVVWCGLATGLFRRFGWR